MYKSAFACAVVLGASMFVSAQQTPPASTPPTFPSDQQQAPAPDRQSKPDSMPPDTSAPPAREQSGSPDVSAPASQQSTDQSSGSARPGESQSIQGCISQDTGMSSGYVLTDASGTKYSLQGDNAKLAKHVGHEVSIKGSAAAAAGSDMSSSQPSASQSQSSASAGQSGSGAASAATQQTPFTVQSLKMISETCSAAQPSK